MSSLVYRSTAKRHIGKLLSGPADVSFLGAFCNAPLYILFHPQKIHKGRDLLFPIGFAVPTAHLAI